MKNLCLTISLLFCVVSATMAKKTGYPVADIPQNLQTGADAVIRLDSTYLEIKDQGFVQKKTFVITVLNEKGNEYAMFRAFYNVFSKISDISGKLYDAEGKQLKSLNTNQVLDLSSFGSSYAFYDDNRFKVFDFDHKQYPYTVAFEYEIKYKSNFFIPAWTIQPDEKLAVEKSVLVLKHLRNFKLQEKAHHFPKQMQIEESEEQDSILLKKWQVEGISAFVHQPYSMTGNFYLPTLELKADQVSLDMYTGNFATWEDFGRFFYQINKDKDELPQEVKDKLRKMTDTIPDARAKVTFLYKYMQEHTRYVANEYGLSGWQTFPAANLAKAGYGDCKGLSNYMKAMLKAIDIPSNLVLIYGSDKRPYQLDRSFPVNSFNHMILCVPMGKDSIWLECTSNSLPAGYLGAFTQDREALLLTEHGGKVVRTPHYYKDRNNIERDIEIRLQPNQDQQQVIWESVYSGVQQDDLCSYLKTTPATKTKERAREIVPYKSTEVLQDEYTYINADQSCPKIKERIVMNVGHLMDETAKRLLISVPLMGNPMRNLLSAVKRTEPIVMNNDCRFTYHYKIMLPEGAKIESMPAGVDIKEPFARYSYKASMKDNALWVDILFEQNKGVYPADMFEAYENMYRKVTQNSGEINVSILK